jgi:hypothetical protein
MFHFNLEARSMRTLLKRAALGAALLFVAACAIPASAQVTTADIIGRVEDVQNAVIPNATVTLLDKGTGTSRTATTTSTGDYSFTLVQPGNYTVRVEAPGFAAFVANDLKVSAGDRARVDASMKLGATTETVEVSTSSVVLQTDSSTVQSVVDSTATQDLPLNGRNFFNLVTVQPGVNSGPPGAISSGTRPDDRRQPSTISANGQSDLYNNNMVDGLDNNEMEQGFIGVRPSIDAIAEVRVLTNNYTAEVGRAGGAVVNVITKSGTNQFHGSAYEFFRNDVFDARSYFLSPTIRKPEFRQNQFGGSIGGPIFRNKTFFFAAVEELRQISLNGGQPVQATVPTLFEEQHPGDFTDIGGPVVTNIDPIALAYFKLYPAPNAPGTRGNANSCGAGCAIFTNNFQATPLKSQYGTTFDARIDHHFSDKNLLFGHYAYNPVSTFVPGAFPSATVNGVTIQPGGGDTFAGPSKSVGQAFQLNDVITLSSKSVLELKFGFTRINIQTYPLNYNVNPSSALGLRNSNIAGDPTTSALAVMNIQNYTTLGQGNFVPILDFNNTFQYAATYSHTLAAHDLKFGGTLIRRQLNYFQPQGSAQGAFTFNNTASGFSLPYTLSVANFLAGRMITQARNNTLIHPNYRTWEPGIFAQDNWHAKRWLTLNLGLRYEIFTPITEAHGRYANFDPSTLTVKVSNDLGTKTDYSNISPRFGFAITMPHDFVMSGGFGMSYYRNEAQSGIQIPNPPYLYGYNCSTNCLADGTPAKGSPAATLSNTPLPIPAGTALDLKSGCPITSTGAQVNGCLTIFYKEPTLSPARIEQANLQLQKKIGENVLTIGYVGELGRNLLYESNYNQPLPPGANQPTPALRFASQIPTVNGINWKTNNGYSNTHLVTLAFQRRFSHGLTLNANYTHMHGLSNSPGPGLGVLVANDPSYDYGNSGFDIVHRYAVTANYQIPTFNTHGFTRAMVGGWQLNGLGYWQSGQPFSVTNGAAVIHLPGVTTDRPDQIAFPRLDNPTLTKWFNTAAFKPQTPGTAGSEKPNQLFGPPDRRIDLSVFRDFKLGDRFKLQFRAESFNIMNIPNFGTPQANLTSPTIGQITSTAANETPRQLQFALKLQF